jgi:hypothetical protein
MLLKLPPEATPAQIESAAPLGSRAEVLALLAELLPGAQVDEHGRLSFIRSDYAIDVDIGKGDPVQTATIELTGQASTVAIRRLLRRTGWRLFAAKRGEFIEPEALGTALAESAPGGVPEALQPPPAAAATGHQPWEATGESARRFSRVAVGLIVLLAIMVAFWWSTRRDQIDVNEQQTIAELLALGRANLGLRAATGCFTTPQNLANPENAARLGASALPPLFATEVRHGYRFSLQGEPIDEENLEGGMIVLFEPSYRSFVYVALPVEPGVSGRRSFAYISDKTAVYARDDVAVPTAADQLVRVH